MNRGSLGDSDVSDDPMEHSFSHETSRTINNPYHRRTRSVENATTSKQASGAARRKGKKPKKQTKALKEIARLQKSTNLLIPKLPFARLVREITLEVNQEVTRYTLLALEALQEATEMFITQVLQDANYLAMHRKCVTITRGDIMLMRFLKLHF